MRKLVNVFTFVFFAAAVSASAGTISGAYAFNPQHKIKEVKIYGYGDVLVKFGKTGKHTIPAGALAKKNIVDTNYFVRSLMKKATLLRCAADALYPNYSCGNFTLSYSNK